MKRLSIRQRLLVLIMSSLLAVWCAMAVFSYHESHEEISELFDSRLEQGANIILLLDLKRLQNLANNEAEQLEDNDGDNDEHNQVLPFQVWSAEGRLLLHNASAPHVSYSPENGFKNYVTEHKKWRTLARWNTDKTLQVRVFEDIHQRRHLASGILHRILTPLLIALPGLALLIWLSVGRGLQPLRALSDAIAARHAKNLDAITLERVPTEVESLIHSLNELLQRLANSLDKERRFTADAAHELRTPLAAIKIQAEVALAAQDTEQHDQALHGIVAGINRTTRLSEQLLMLARLDHHSLETQQTLDLSLIAQQAASRYANRALDKQIELSVLAETPILILGEPNLLDSMISNLLDNAIRYTPEQGRIEVAVHIQKENASLSVKDNGPGLSDADKTRVLDRFYRVEGQTSSGSGLGLSIVERIAQVHGAHIQLDRGLDQQGLGVQISGFKTELPR